MNASMTATTAPNPTFALTARVLIGALFLVAGTRKLLGFAAAAAYFAKLGFPASEAVTVLAIIIELVGGILLVVGWRTRWVAWLLIAFVAIATGMAHRFWEFDAAQMNNQLNHFLKNIAIIGGLLMFVSFGPGAASVDKS